MSYKKSILGFDGIELIKLLKLLFILRRLDKHDLSEGACLFILKARYPLAGANGAADNGVLRLGIKGYRVKSAGDLARLILVGKELFKHNLTSFQRRTVYAVSELIF